MPPNNGNRLDKKKDAAESGRAGGLIRASRLSPEERSEIARKAAQARWKDKEQKPSIATHVGELEICGKKIPCAVLEDGTRVLTQAGVLRALGRHEKARGRGKGDTDTLPAFLRGTSIKPFVSNELRKTTRPILFKDPRGGVVSYGFRAEILPLVCTAFLEARDEHALNPKQHGIAKTCDLLMRGLAHVGIAALVDEATGFQYDRARDALSQLLEKYIAKELARWIKTFPDEFW